MADANDLQTGDKIYSKHIVDGKVREYTIENILPVITHVRGIKENSHYDGVLVMGYDDQYASNITHKNIIFTKEPIEMLALQCSAMPEDIVYRSDEISAITKALVPYLTVYILAAVVCVTVLTLFLTQEIAHNFRRLLALGFDRRYLNRAYYKVVGETGAISIAATAIASALVFSRAGFNLTAFMPVICAVVVEVFTLSVATIVSNWRLWRK